MLAETPLSPALMAQRPLQTEAEIAPAAIEWLFVCAANDRVFFDDARRLIEESYFHSNEEPLRILWRVLCYVYDQYQGVTFQNLKIVYENTLREQGALTLTQQHIDVIFRPDENGLLYSTSNPPPGAINQANLLTARQLLKKFAYDRGLIHPMRRMLSAGPGMVPTQLDDFMKSVDAHRARITSTNAMPLTNVMPDPGEDREPPNVFKRTGVDWIDGPFGGQRVGDTYGLIGPTGGGKTTTALFIAMQTAKQCWLDHLQGQPEEAVIFVTAEEEGEKLLPRAWSNAFRIPREKLESSGLSNLTTKDNLQDYEIRMAGADNVALGDVQSELDRYKMGALWFPRHFHILDLSGSEKHPDAGRGGVAEIISYLHRLQDQLKIAYRSVFIDYAGLFVGNYMQANGLDGDRHERRLLRDFGKEVKRGISSRFGCTSWVLHQVKGALGEASPAKLMHHSNAGDSADFAVNMSVCGCLGTEDKPTGCRRFNWSKVRFLKNANVPPIILRFHETFADVVDVTSQFTISETTRQILSNSEAQSVGGVEAVQRRQAGMTGHPARTGAPNSNGASEQLLAGHNNTAGFPTG